MFCTDPVKQYMGQQWIRIMMPCRCKSCCKNVDDSNSVIVCYGHYLL